MRTVQAVSRLERAARKYLEHETRIARDSYHLVLDGGRFNDEIWKAADPIGARLAIELRRALEKLI